MAGHLNGNGFDVQSVTANDEVHVYLIGAFAEGVFAIDIHPSVYERGSGYSWTKIPDVKFTADHVGISRLDKDPKNMYIYVES
jgi:hypothetical protein